ncbi:MAG: hypothetical protein ACMG6E_02575 [Candidatus Roizmanbacteria bacterium]
MDRQREMERLFNDLLELERRFHELAGTKAPVRAPLPETLDLLDLADATEEDNLATFFAHCQDPDQKKTLVTITRGQEHCGTVMEHQEFIWVVLGTPMRKNRNSRLVTLTATFAGESEPRMAVGCIYRAHSDCRWKEKDKAMAFPIYPTNTPDVYKLTRLNPLKRAKISQ